MSTQQRLGQFWLAWRTDREEWAICWNDSAAGTRRRKSTGVGDYNDGEAPSEATQKLAEHFARHGKPEAIDPNAKASVSRVVTTWLAKEGGTRARAAQYSYAVDHIQRWLDTRGQKMVSEITPVTTRDYIDMRLGEGVKGETVVGELAALQRALRWAENEGMIPYAPRVAKVPETHRSGPREHEFEPKEVAAILNAATERLDRLHVATFAITMLSTHARVEAILEAWGEQVRGDLFYSNAADRRQTRKRRSIIPIVPALKPWLPTTGKIITYRTFRKDGSLYERPTYTIKNAFAGCLSAAGIERGSPNTLRHTIHTALQARGVPQAQIDAAAGHSSETGSGRNYTHLRPEYLREFKEAIEDYWREMDQFTTVHRSPIGPNRFDTKTGLRLK